MSKRHHGFLVGRLFAAAVISALASQAVAAPTPGFSGDVRVKASGVLYGTSTIGTPTFSLNVENVLPLAPGAGAGKADRLYAGERTLAASATENLDLAGGLTDPLGAALTFVKVKAILVTASASNTNNVVVGGAGSNGFLGPFADATDKVVIPPGGAVLLTAPVAGWTVTPSTGDLLLVANSSSGTTVTYKVVIIGASS